MKRAAAFALLFTLAGCGGSATGVASASDLRALSWQQQIHDGDRKRLATLWSAWTRSLGEAAPGHGAAMAALGPLTVADATVPGALPGPGDYRCRTVKMGVRSDAPAGAPAMTAGDWRACRIASRGPVLWFEQAEGAQRVGGTLYADGDRLVFLGSMALAGEMGFMAYGADAARDQVGVVRRLGDGRWRLELPWPNWQSNLEVIEISAL